MRVVCPFCSKKAIITSSNVMNEERTVTDLYCSCSNVKECGATFVFCLAYKHVLNPPARTAAEMALNLVDRLSREEKAALRQDSSDYH